MKKYKLSIYFLLLLSPFILVVIVNESFKPAEKYTIKLNLSGNPNIVAYNSDKKENDKCTWFCHNFGCSHSKKNWIKTGIISNIYNSIISFNRIPEKNGIFGLNYQLMNLIFLVVLWPLLMYILLILNLNQILKKK